MTQRFACGSKELELPLSPSGEKPGRAGSPHAATRAAPANPAGTPPAAAPPTSKAPAWRGSIRERNLVHAAVHGRLIEAQVVEVGRSPSGAVKTKHKRGPKFRAPYSGYGLRQHPRLIPIRRVLPFARLGLYLSRKDKQACPSQRSIPKSPARRRPRRAKANGAEKGKGCVWKIDPY